MLTAEHGGPLTDRGRAWEAPHRQVVDISGIRGDGLEETRGRRQQGRMSENERERDVMSQRTHRRPARSSLQLSDDGVAFLPPKEFEKNQSKQNFGRPQPTFTRLGGNVPTY